MVVRSREGYVSGSSSPLTGEIIELQEALNQPSEVLLPATQTCVRRDETTVSKGKKM